LLKLGGSRASSSARSASAVALRASASRCASSEAAVAWNIFSSRAAFAASISLLVWASAGTVMNAAAAAPSSQYGRCLIGSPTQ
jgi:hypothetical protein